MKNKELEILFLTYLTDMTTNNVDMQVKEDEEMWLLFSEDDFHINRKNNTLYLKHIDILLQNIFKENLELEGKVDWVAYQKNPLTLEHLMSVGTGNPFTNQALVSFVNNKALVKAIPFQYVRKMKKQHKVL